MNNIFIVIPMFGKASYTDACIDSVVKNYGTGEPIEILVVDDGSEIPYLNPKVNVLRLDSNSGFTNASNQGILWGQDRFDYVLLLNNDTIAQPGFLYELVQVMSSDPSIGIAASIRVHPDRLPQNMELCGADLIRGFQYFTDEKSLPDIPIEVNWIPLASGLLRMSMVREIGLLDKRFRNFCSDSDYCIRAKMNGWKVMMVARSRVIHHLSVTTSASGVTAESDQKKFLEKLAGLQYAELMKQMPLDGEAKTWGRFSFSVYEK